MTGQVLLDSYVDAGVLVALDLVNQPALEDGGAAALARLLERDPASVAQLRPRDVPGFAALARDLRRVFDDLHAADLSAAAARLNRLLARHPAHPHLAMEDGRWRLHHHPMRAALVPMWTAICAEAIARAGRRRARGAVRRVRGTGLRAGLLRRVEERDAALLLDDLPEPGEGGRVPRTGPALGRALVRPVGLEPTTRGLKGRRSTD